MTKQQETDYIQAILEFMLTQDDGYHYVGFNDPNFGYTQEEFKALRQTMLLDGLITKHDNNHGKISKLTAFGYRVARTYGGYKGFLKAQEQEHVQQHQEKLQQQRLQFEQQQQQREQLELNRAATTHAARSAIWSRYSGWAAIGSMIIAAAASYISYKSTADSSAVEKRVNLLELQVRTLKTQLNVKIAGAVQAEHLATTSLSEDTIQQPKTRAALKQKAPQ